MERYTKEDCDTRNYKDGVPWPRWTDDSGPCCACGVQTHVRDRVFGEYVCSAACHDNITQWRYENWAKEDGLDIEADILYEAELEVAPEGWRLSSVIALSVAIGIAAFLAGVTVTFFTLFSRGW